MSIKTGRAWTIKAKIRDDGFNGQNKEFAMAFKKSGGFKFHNYLKPHKYYASETYGYK